MARLPEHVDEAMRTIHNITGSAQSVAVRLRSDLEYVTPIDPRIVTLDVVIDHLNRALDAMKP